MWPKWRENKPFALGLLILIAYAILFLWVKTDYTIAQRREVGKPTPLEHSITVDALGKAVGKPDLATVNVTVESRDPDAAAAQTKNTGTMNDVLGKIKALGISDDDIQTSAYNSWQDCVWNQDTQVCEPTDWVVSSTATVKVRDTAKVGDVLQVAGQNGATVSGPNLTVDDTTSLQAEARDKAMDEALKKAKAIADKLHLKIEKVIGYSEYSNDAYPPVPYAADRLYATGGGTPAPDVQAGSQEVSLTVSVTFKLAD